MPMKSKLATTALLAPWRRRPGDHQCQRFGCTIPENATRFCDDVTFSCGTQLVPQETCRYQSDAAPRHGGRPVPARTTSPRSRRKGHELRGGGGGGAAVAVAGGGGGGR